MRASKVVTKSVLQILAFIAASGLAAEFASRPSQSFGIVLTLLAASFRPIWKDGRIFDRIVLFVLAALVGLSVWQFIGSVADYLFHSGIFDAGEAAKVAGYKVLGSLAAFLVTLVDIRRITDRITAKWMAHSSSRLSFVSAGILTLYAPFPVILIYVELGIEESFVAYLGLIIVAIGAFPLVYRGIDRLRNSPLFGLRGPKAEGPRRLGLLTGWVIGAPIALLILAVVTEWFDNGDMILLIPLVAITGFMLTYLLVHAIFWAIEGFRPKSE